MKVSGIYYYIDLKNDEEIVYIGKDNNIGVNKRYYDHKVPSNYNSQPFNKIIQKNPKRYIYDVFLKGNISEKLLNGFEKAFIRMYDPKFNYTAGGDGSTGYKHSDESKEKMRNAKKRAKNTSGYYRVSKKKDVTCKQGFMWVYQYYDENGKPKRISRTNIDKLKEVVIEKGLEWLEYDMED